MNERQQVELKLEVPDGQAFGWPEFREFMDALTKALAAMPQRINPSLVMPVAVKHGSVCPVLELPPGGLDAVAKLRTGPDMTWTQPMWRGASSLYQVVTKRNMRLLEAGQLFVVPDDDAARWFVHQAEVLDGKLLRVGGALGDVEINFDHEPTARCQAGREVAQAIAQRGLLYRRIRVHGVARRTLLGGHLLRFNVEHFEALGDVRHPAVALAALHGELGGVGFDVDAALKDLRE